MKKKISDLRVDARQVVEEISDAVLSFDSVSTRFLCKELNMIAEELEFAERERQAGELHKEENKPEYGKQYSLTGGKGQKCVMNGDSWKDSEVK